MLLSRFLGRLSSRVLRPQVVLCESNVNSRFINAPNVRKLTMSNNLELPSHYDTASIRLSEVLGCSKQDSCAILMEFPEIKKLEKNNLASRCDYLTKDLGISTEHIVDFPWLLKFSKTLLAERVQVLTEKTKCAVSSIIPLLQFPPNKLHKIFSYKYKEDTENLDEESQDRIRYLAKKLKCSELKVCNVITKHNFLLMIPLHRLERVFTIFEEYKVEPSDVLKDIWILRYKPEQISSRLDIIKSVGMDKAKPWMTRSTEQVFQRSLARFKKHEELVEMSADKLNFVQSRLKLDSYEDAVQLALKHPAILRLTLTRLKFRVERLFAAGFTLEEIKATANALAYNSKMITDRQKLLAEKYQYKANLILLTRTPAKFSEFLDKLEYKKNAGLMDLNNL